MTESSVQFEKKRLLAVLSVLTFGLATFFAVLGVEFLVPTIFVLGFFIVVPLVALFGDSLPIVENEADGVEIEREQTEEDPIEQLRERYANGELTDEEFERRLERLLETEDVEMGDSRERVFERE